MKNRKAIAGTVLALLAAILLSSCNGETDTNPPAEGSDTAVVQEGSETAEVPAEDAVNGMAVTFYNSVREMKKATDLKPDTMVRTRGYTLATDAGGATYYIRNKNNDDVEDGMEKIFLQNDLVAIFAEETHVRPEQFGASGTGRADDTDELKLCIKYMEDGYTFTGTERYGTKEPLKLAKTVGVPYYYDFNSATIMAIEPMDSIFYFERTSDTGYVPTYIRNVRLDCNSKAERAIHIVWIRAMFLDDIFILNPTKYGIEVEKGALYTDNIMMNVLDYSLKPTGIYMHEASTDSKIYNVRMRDYPVAIRAEGAANFFHNVHAWLINQPIAYSTFMEYKGSQHVSQSYSDTYHISFKSLGGGTLTVDDCQFFPNTDFYKASDPAPIIFTTETSYRTSGRVYMSNCYFQFNGYYEKYGKVSTFIANNGKETNTKNWIDLREDNQINPAYFKNMPSWVDGKDDEKITPAAGVTVTQNSVRIAGESAAVQYSVKFSSKLTASETEIGRLEDITLLPMGAEYPDNYVSVPCTLSDSASGKIGTGAVRFYYAAGSNKMNQITVIGGAGFDTVTVFAELPLNWIEDNP